MTALLVAGLGVAAFFYLPHGIAIGVAVLAIRRGRDRGVGERARSSPRLSPALAALIATAYLPRIVESHSTFANVPVGLLHEAFFSNVASPFWLRVVVLAVAALPFALAARLIVR